MISVKRKGNKVQVALPTGAPSFAGLLRTGRARAYLGLRVACRGRTTGADPDSLPRVPWR
jgi:hypothetical protein